MTSALCIILALLFTPIAGQAKEAGFKVRLEISVDEALKPQEAGTR